MSSKNEENLQQAHEYIQAACKKYEGDKELQWLRQWIGDKYELAQRLDYLYGSKPGRIII